VTWYQPASVARLLELKAQFPKAKVVCAQGGRTPNKYLFVCSFYHR